MMLCLVLAAMLLSVTELFMPTEEKDEHANA